MFIMENVILFSFENLCINNNIVNTLWKVPLPLIQIHTWKETWSKWIKLIGIYLKKKKTSTFNRDIFRIFFIFYIARWYLLGSISIFASYTIQYMCAMRIKRSHFERMPCQTSPPHHHHSILFCVKHLTIIHNPWKRDSEAFELCDVLDANAFSSFNVTEHRATNVYTT